MSSKSPLKKELTLKGLSEEDYKIVKRLLNIKGQIDGLLKMIGDKRGLIDIIIQLKATKSAFNKAGTMYITDHLSKALKEEKPTKKQREFIKQIINELSRY